MVSCLQLWRLTAVVPQLSKGALQNRSGHIFSLSVPWFDEHYFKGIPGRQSINKSVYSIYRGNKETWGKSNKSAA